MDDIYHKGNRGFQGQFDTRELADRLIEHMVHDEITDDDRKFIVTRNVFFISTSNENGERR